MATKTFYTTKDAFAGDSLSNSTKGWNGKDNHLQVGVSNGKRYRSMVYFSLDFTGMFSIDSAILTLTNGPTSSANHDVQSSPPSNLYIARMTADWGEGTNDPGEGEINTNSQFTWDLTTHFSNTNSVTQAVTSSGLGTLETFDVTAMVRDWFGGANNYGFLLRNDSSESSASKTLLFMSRDSDASNRARLDITYTANNAPNPPTMNSPKDNEVVNSLSPSFSVTRSDPDAGDYITGVNLRVYKPIGRYVFDSGTGAGPASGEFRLNNADPISASTLYISETDADSISRATVLASLSTSGSGGGLYSDTIALASQDGDGYVTWIVLGANTDSGTYRTISGGSYAASGLFADGETVWLFIQKTTGTPNSGWPGWAGSPLWDSGQVTVTGNPTTVSIPYGTGVAGPPLAGDTTYAWTARTKDKGGLWSWSWSNFEFFKPNSIPNAPLLSISPLPTTSVPTTTPTFTITHQDPDVSDTQMHGYRFVVQLESAPGSGSWATAWDSGDIDTSGSPASTKAITSAALTNGGSYKVQARTKDRNGAWGSYTVFNAFTVFGTTAPINLSPAGSEPTSLTPTFYGERTSGQSAMTSYQILLWSDDLQTQVWDSGTLTTGISGGSAFSKLYDGTALAEGTAYQWQVRITKDSGTSLYSALQRFVTSDATVPTITVPVGTGINTVTPTVTASRTASFNRFQIEVYPAASTTTSLGTVHWASGTQSATIGAGGLGTQFTFVYNGPALSWGATYKVRTRASSDAGVNYSAWSGLVAFTTSASGTAVLLGVDNVLYPLNPWLAHLDQFHVGRAGSDTIDKIQILLYDATITTVLWDSGMVDVTNGTSFVFPYTGSDLPGGTYHWTAKYQIPTGPIGSYAPTAQFTMNTPPNIPTNRFPTQGYALPDSLLPIFRATFSDADTNTLLDYASEWEIVVEEEDGTPVDTINITVGLSDVNEYQWLITDTTLSFGSDYRWRTRFKDSQDVWGAYSSYSSFSLRIAPNGTITTPSNGSVVNLATPVLNWSYVSAVPQSRFTIDINRTDDTGTFLNDVFLQTVVSSAHLFTIPGGYLVDNRYYDITLTVYDEDGVVDPTPSTVNVLVEQNPPNPIVGLSATTFPAYVSLDWDVATMRTTPVVHSFVRYNVYRRLQGDEDWAYLGSVNSRTNPFYSDWYAGNSIRYQYRVTTVATVVGQNSVQIESPDDPNGGSFVEVVLDQDAWVLVGADRSDEHIHELPVTEENHNRVVQQESFETLGSPRKVILRGFVLGHEGSITCMWTDALVPLPTDPQVLYEEHIIGRRILDYITAVKGPHLLKSPFGDVWDVEFSGPQYGWSPGASLEVTLEWVETGQTSQVSV